MLTNRLSAPVLVLNANFQPLNVCTTRRAVGLMLSEKASLVINGRGFIQGVSQQYPSPSVIRLECMVKRPRPIVKLSKAEIFRRDNYACQYCGRKVKNLTIDHVIPRSQGGEHTWENLVAACPACNHQKGNRTAEQANMQLRNKPQTPSASARYIFGRYLPGNLEWLPYVEGW